MDAKLRCSESGKEEGNFFKLIIFLNHTEYCQFGLEASFNTVFSNIFTFFFSKEDMRALRRPRFDLAADERCCTEQAKASDTSV